MLSSSRVSFICLPVASRPPTRLLTLVRFNDSGTKTPFGDSWRDHVGNTCGFQFGVRSGSLCSIRNLSGVACQRPLHAQGTRHYFLLLDEEYVLKLELFCDETKVRALRLHTNMRSSPWYGKCAGNYSVHVAPEGQLYKSIHGEFSTLKVKFNAYIDACIHLGVVVQPIPRAMKDSLDNFVRSELVFDRESASKVEVFSDSPRAVVMRVGAEDLADVTVLSEGQYQDFVSLTGFNSDDDEHWFVLVPHEAIEAVGVSVCSVENNDKMIDGLKFRTNSRSSVWFGEAKGEETWFDHKACPGAVVCGFQLEGEGSYLFKKLTNIGVIYKLPVTGAAEGGEQASKAA